MTSKLARERLEKIKSWRETYGAGSNVMLPAEEAEELARMALAAMDSEPVAVIDQSNLDYLRSGADADVWPPEREEMGDVLLYRHAQPAKSLELAGWQFKSVNGDWLGLIDEHGKNQAVREGCEVREVFAMADGVNERDQVRREHAEWSQATFGNVGPVGPLKHLSKEALEAAAEPGDLSEWADMQFLLWDAQRRAGITDEQITQAMIEKLAVNKLREWPEPKDGEPRLHIKEQPAPVVLDDTKLRELFDSWFASDCSFDLSPEASEADNIAWRESYWYVWQRCRAAMLQACDTVRDLSTPVDPQVAEYEQNVLQAGNSPVTPDGSAVAALTGIPMIPDGYVMVPKEPTEEMLQASYREASVYSPTAYRAMIAAAPQEAINALIPLASRNEQEGK